MGNTMFSLSRAAKLSITNNPEILRKLTAIRVSDYKISLMNHQLEAQDYQLILIHIKELGEKILKVNLIHDEGTDAFNIARAKFNDLVNNLSQNNRFSLVFYAAQLLQFYTLLCDDNFIPKANFSSFNQFLSNNKDKFGETDTNLFIVEYTLILIYNDFVSSLASHAEVDEAVKDSDGKMGQSDLGLITKKLKTIKDHLDKWGVDAPNNIFMIYLDFVHQYTSAKLLEFQYEMQQENLTDEIKLQLSIAQEAHINLAKEALDKIDEVNQFNKDRKTKLSTGLEYSLGQDLLSKLPETNIDVIRKHLLSLLSINEVQE